MPRPSAVAMLSAALDLLHDRELAEGDPQRLVAAQRIVEVYAQAAVAEELHRLNALLPEIKFG